MTHRTDLGQFKKGFSGNPRGRLPRQTEAKYLETLMGAVSQEDWALIVGQAVLDAKDPDAYIRYRAREWLGKYLIGEPAQVHRLLYQEERDIHVHITFGDQELSPIEIIDGVVTPLLEAPDEHDQC